MRTSLSLRGRGTSDLIPDFRLTGDQLETRVFTSRSQDGHKLQSLIGNSSSQENL